MIRSSFFNSVSGDRKYNASRFAEYFASFIGNGVFPIPLDGLQVVSNDDMTVTIKEGKAWIDGYLMINDDDYILNIDVADGVLKRIDRVVARYGVAERDVWLEVKKGTFASVPVAPSLQRDADAYELGLADILINNGVVSIIQTNITDLRSNTEFCGRVDSLIAGDIISIASDLATHEAEYELYKIDVTSKLPVTGTYTGDGVEGRTIVVGFKPSFVLIKARTTATRMWLVGDGTAFFSPMTFSGAGDMVGTGFVFYGSVGTDNPNKTGEVYTYVAFR